MPHAPHQPHSETSRAAAEDILPKAGTLRRAVFDFLAARGSTGATDEEIQSGLQMSPSTERPRRIELVQQRLVRNSGETRRTRSGKQATVWAVAERRAPGAVRETQNYLF